MKVLIINSNRFKQPWPVMPLGVCMVAASIEDSGHEVEVLDLCFSKDCIGDIDQSLQKFHPDIIGISIRNIDNCVGHAPIFLLDEQKEIIQHLKKNFKGAIILGGGAVSINGEEILEYFDLSYASCGDGERVMREVVNQLAEKKELYGVKGLIIRENGKIVQKGEYLFDDELNDLPLHLPNKYLNLKDYDKFDSDIQIQTKRGCALKCSYCPNKYIEGNHYRLFNPERIADHIEMMVKETGIHRIEFVDSTFNFPLKHTKKVLKAIIAKKMDITLNALGLYPGSIDEELIDLMKEAGFQTACLGLDAACDTTLKCMQKQFTTEDIAKVAKIIKARKMPISWFLLMGCEEETYQSMHESMEFVRKQASFWDAVFIAVGLRIYKGSPIADRMKESKTENIGDNFLHPVVVDPPKLDLEAVSILTRRYSMDRPNFIIYNYDNAPEFVIRMSFKLVKNFFPKMPIIRMHILGNLINKITGLTLMLKVVFYLRHRKILKKIKQSVKC